MPNLPFSSLPPQQQAQAGRIFQDATFGIDPAAFAYEMESDTGELVGQRSQVSLLEKKVQHGNRAPISIITSGAIKLSNQGAHILARMLLPSFVSDPVLATAPALADLPVAGPSRNLPSWDQAG
jgi:hypothetical protein